MTSKEYLDRWFQRVWVEEDSAAISELAAPDALFRGLEETALSGPDEFRLFHRMMLDQFGEYEIEIHNSLEQGEWTAVLGSVSCKHRQTGKKVTTRVYAMAQFKGGLMIEGHNLMDSIQFFEACDLLPPRTLDQLLLGQKAAFVKPGGQKYAS